LKRQSFLNYTSDVKKNMFHAWSHGTYDYLDAPRRKLVDRFFLTAIILFTIASALIVGNFIFESRFDTDFPRIVFVLAMGFCALFLFALGRAQAAMIVMGSAMLLSTGWGFASFALKGDAESIIFYSLTEIISAGIILFVSATLLGPIAGLVAAMAGGVALFIPMWFSGSVDLQSTLPYSLMAWSIASTMAIMIGVLSSGFAQAIMNEAEQATQDCDRAVKAKTELEKVLRENEALLHEVHHRVKNNLQIMASVIDLQADYSGDEKIQEALSVTRRRVEAMALAHETLYASEALGEFDLSAFIIRLCGDAAASFPDRLPSIRFSYELSQEKSNLSTAVSCALAVSELVSNAVQHAPYDLPILIRPSLHREGDDLIVSIFDNGPGIPVGAESAEGSLGLKLVDNLAGGLGGTFSISLDRHCAIFRFPSPNPIQD